MERRILILVGHPGAASLNRSLADTYAAAARDAGAEVRITYLGELSFDLSLAEGYGQELEPDLVQAQRDVEWCEHLVVFTPVWWGSMPALLKGFFDRAFLPNWAFRYDAKLPVKLLRGRTAQVIGTMDSPGWWYRLAQRKSLHRTLGTGTLEFVGFKTRFRMLPKVRDASAAKREAWLGEIAALGARQAKARRRSRPALTGAGSQA